MQPQPHQDDDTRPPLTAGSIFLVLICLAAVWTPIYLAGSAVWNFLQAMR